MQSIDDDVLRVLRQARIPFTGRVIRGNAVEVHITRDDRYRQCARQTPRTVATGRRFCRHHGTAHDRRRQNGNVITLTPTDAAVTERVRQAVDQSIEIIERRVNEIGLVEPSIQREGIDRILVQVPGLQDPTRLKDIAGQDREARFPHGRFIDDARAGLGNASAGDSEVLDGQEPGQKYLIEKRVLVSGGDLVDAQPGFDQRTNEPVVNFRFNSSGARKFAEATQANVGKPFAIVLDNKVISAPVIREPILGGQARFPAISPFSRQTTSPSCCAPVRCRRR